MVPYGTIWYYVVSYGATPLTVRTALSKSDGNHVLRHNLRFRYKMVLYGTICYHMLPYATSTIWYHMVPYGTIWYHMVPYGAIWYNMVPYVTIWVLKLSFPIVDHFPQVVPYGTIYPMVPYGTIWYHMVPYSTIWYNIFLD